MQVFCKKKSYQFVFSMLCLTFLVTSPMANAQVKPGNLKPDPTINQSPLKPTIKSETQVIEKMRDGIYLGDLGFILEGTFDNGDDGTQSSPIKIAATRKFCWDPSSRTTVDCGFTDCPTNGGASFQAGNTTYTCNLNCSGVRPDANGVCDCPIAIDDTGALDCDPPIN